MRISVSLLFVAMLWSCAMFIPATDPPKPGFACTNYEHACTFGPSGKPTACCGNDSDCSGSPEFPGCSEPGTCCANGGADESADSFGAKRRRTTPQRTQ